MSEPRDDERPEPGSASKATADLEARIAQARRHGQAEARPAQPSQGNLSGMSRGYRLASEFVAAIIVGGGLGYIIDMFLPTRPWGMVGLLLLGFAAGVLNVVRASAQMNAPVPPDTPAVRDDEDD
jgi:ATP synthase protein I